jgi:ubiquinone/menaquinone biosynthesis C-methylase UbiE
VLSRVQQANQDGSRARILDAGSGVTFFPYYLSAQSDTAKICCCDYDETLSEVFEHINSGLSKRVEFSAADLRDLPYANEWFDIIYCISVLEHTGEHERIVEEFFRILRPGGTLVVTFDVSLDGTRAISVDAGSALLSRLMKRFDKDKDLSLDLHSHLSEPGVLTTLSAQESDASLLPWKFPPLVHRIKASIAARRIVSWPPPVSVFCVGLTRRCA